MLNPFESIDQRLLKIELLLLDLKHPEPESRYLTPKELSKLTGLSVNTIYQYNSEDKLPGLRKVGGKILFEREAIIAWIEGGCK